MRPRRAAVVRFVYILRDADGQPLYVGLTRDVTNRLKTHSCKPYWPDVADVSVEMVFGLDASAQRERELIRELSPRLNQRDREWQPVSGVRCHYFRYCGAAASTVRRVVYGGVSRGVRHYPVCDLHAVDAHLRKRARQAVPA